MKNALLLAAVGEAATGVKPIKGTIAEIIEFKLKLRN